MKFKRRSRRWISLLDAERLALLEGRLENLSEIHEKKSKLIDELNRLDIEDQQKMLGLRSKVERNQDLLNSALEGIRAVSRRLAEVRRVRTNLDTYTEQGEKAEIATQPERALEKRA